MYKIYLIKDYNGLEYVGKTKQSFSRRMALHRYKKNNGYNHSSSKLDLDNCDIILLEECDYNIASEREQYWMNQYPKRVNECNAIHNQKEYNKQYHKQLQQYQKSWGGRTDKNNNSLLKIDIDYFSS